MRRLTLAVTFAAGAALAPAVASAHETAVTPSTAPSAWSFEPPVVVALLVAAALYALGVRALWSRAGIGRGIAAWRAACFALGLAVSAAALISPLDAMGHALVSAHMTQHMLLTLVAAPLLVFGQPPRAFAWALPRGGRRALRRAQRARGVPALGRTLTHPAVAWSLFAFSFWIWHVPGVYDAAVRHDALHAVEHATFVAGALLFWWMAIEVAGRRRFDYGAAAVFVFTTMLQMSILAALLTFSERTWYGVYTAADTSPWHLTTLQDQQLAGLTMWMESNFVYFVAVAALIALWLRDDERRVTRDAQPHRLAVAE
ncbi:MAG TPA: cytochrome c oxidase assembly protein [Dehalococcoidia bacterium]|nr:cytochrome c oxidase assembly protein [Dehalococcoidia bacterium]